MTREDVAEYWAHVVIDDHYDPDWDSDTWHEYWDHTSGFDDLWEIIGRRVSERMTTASQRGLEPDKFLVAKAVGLELLEEMW